MAQQFFDEDAADIGSILEKAAYMAAGDADFLCQPGAAQAKAASRRWQDAVRVVYPNKAEVPEQQGRIRVSQR